MRMKIRRRNWLFALWVMFLLISGCTSKPEIHPPGRIIIYSDSRQTDAKYYQIIPATWDVAIIKLEGIFGKPVLPQGVKPLGPQITQEDDGAIRIVDQEGGKNRQVVSRETGNPILVLNCGSFSPDGKKAAFVTPAGLYITGLDGQADPALARRHADYGQYLVPGMQQGQTKEYSAVSPISCPIWIGTNDLVVEHRRGGFPNEIEIYENPLNRAGGGSAGLKEDTTSVLHIDGNEFTLKPVDPRWCLTAVSSDYKFAIIGFFDEAGCPGYGDTYLADIDFLLSGSEQQPVRLGDSRSPKFSPDNQKVAFFDGLSHYREVGKLLYLNIWDAERKIALGRYETGLSDDLFWSPDSNAIAYVDRITGKPRIWIFVLNDWKSFVAPGKFSDPEIVDWIE